jgi:purine-nucleoside phosphorylase
MGKEFENHVAAVEEAADFLRRQVDFAPEVILALGTGLGGVADRLEGAQRLPFAAIPHFPASMVASHAGNLLFGMLGGHRVAVLQGRQHYYEGYSARQLTLPVRVLSRLGPSVMIIANAAGGLNPAMTPGSLMVMADHLNFIPDNPLRGPDHPAWGPRFPDLSAPYDAELRDKAILCATELGLAHFTTGVYVAIPGPSLETPAETRYLRRCGADAVGMSTVPEVIVARHAGLKVLGLSVIANVNDPDNFAPILLEEIIAQANLAAVALEQLVVAVLKVLDRKLPGLHMTEMPAGQP